MRDSVTCDLCGKTKPRNEITLMQEGIGIRLSKKSRLIETKIRNWVESYSGKKIPLFPFLCLDCQQNEYFRLIISGKIK